jgi:phosphoserine phosphatase
MTLSPRRIALAVIALWAAIASIGCATTDPLPSWNQTDAKRAILDFVEQAADPLSDGYIAPEERIATFDNDGTLWPERPLIQGLFVLARLEEMAMRDPSLRQRQPFKAALDRDLSYLHEQGEEAILKLVAATHADMSQEEFEAFLPVFFEQANHPTLKAPITSLAYKPMVELLDFLRENGFEVYICSGGGADFVRAISERMYGVDPSNVIGSTLTYAQRDVAGRSMLWRTAELGTFNDKAVKPASIHEHIGKRPAFAAGNVRSGGDIEMLRYSQGRMGPSMQLLINHDDAGREFEYVEDDNASLGQAKQNDWIIVSMQHDWRRIFSEPTTHNTGRDEE